MYIDSSLHIIAVIQSGGYGSYRHDFYLGSADHDNHDFEVMYFPFPYFSFIVFF